MPTTTSRLPSWESELSAGRALGRVTRPTHAVMATVAGVTLWFIGVKLVDDYWLFYPWGKMLELLGG